MGRGKTKEELEKTRKPFTSETAREAQKKSVASRKLHTPKASLQYVFEPYLYLVLIYKRLKY